VILRDRKLNIAPAIKKQTFCAPNETIYYAAATHPSLINNMSIEQFPPAAAAAAALYSPGVYAGMLLVVHIIMHRFAPSFFLFCSLTSSRHGGDDKDDDDDRNRTGGKMMKRTHNESRVFAFREGGFDSCSYAAAAAAHPFTSINLTQYSIFGSFLNTRNNIFISTSIFFCEERRGCASLCLCGAICCC
jgi:hypothetical protein